MPVFLILGVLAAVVIGVVLLQRNQTRKTSHPTYFSQTLGVSDPTPAPVQAEDETSRPL